MADEVRHCRFEKLKAYDPCEPYKTRLKNGMQIYCPRCRAHASRWLKRKSDEVARYGDRLRYNAMRLQTWTDVTIAVKGGRRG